MGERKVNFDWVNEQMAKAKVRVAAGRTVISLLKAWEQSKHDDKFSSQAIETFAKLALGHSLVPENGDEVWVPARPGYIKVADEVRVRYNAYDGDLGIIHNGRRGKVTAIRSGDIIIRTTDDRQPHIDGAHHSPYALEKRIK